MPEINRRQPLCGAPSLQPLVHQLATPTCANNHGNKLLCGCKMKQISQATSCVMPFAKRLAQFDLVHASHLWPSTGRGGGTISASDKPLAVWSLGAANKPSNQLCAAFTGRMRQALHPGKPAANGKITGGGARKSCAAFTR